MHVKSIALKSKVYFFIIPGVYSILAYLVNIQLIMVST
ncbi:hypothetical protein C900_02077 [Fulvivirga imtechensis AK7]|uniref:Uncharacterized protein n=1 Tax=Fulvivirga imtechensis AK7 TaxID=1237149 RepID=L8JZU7_9BACT|nr:hypothetical protein C900_02077 [Fulvivirga imtechensis AK7]